VELAAKLWSLFGDKTIVGLSQRPAAWLFTNEDYIDRTCGQLERMVGSSDDAVGLFIGSLTSRPAGSRAGAAAVHEAMRLASLVPLGGWGALQAAAAQVTAWAGQQVSDRAGRLCLYASSIPLLRTVAMLAIVGKLTKQQHKGVVALLGGSSPGSKGGGKLTAGDSSSFIVPEPAELVRMRAQDGSSLASLAEALFLTCYVQLPSDFEKRVWSCITHTAQAFSSSQAPILARLLTDAITPGYTTPAYQKLSQAGPYRSAYLGWVDASLMAILRDVISSNCRT
jgi:hypothetical protein